MCSKRSSLFAVITVLIVLFCASCIQAAPLEIVSYKEGCKESKINNGLKCGMFFGFFYQFLNPSLLKFCVCFLSWQGINPNFYCMGMKAFTIFVLYVTNKCSFIFVLAREFDRLWKNEKTIHCPLQIIICMVSGFNPFYIIVLLFGNDMSMKYTDYVNTKLKFWHLRRSLSILLNEGNLLLRPYNYQYNETKKINHIHLFCFTDAIPYTGLWYFKGESGLHAQITLWLV